MRLLDDFEGDPNWDGMRWVQTQRLLAGGAVFGWEDDAGEWHDTLAPTIEQKDEIYDDWAAAEVLDEWLCKGIDDEYRAVLGIDDRRVPDLLEAHGIRTLRDLLVIGWGRLELQRGWGELVEGDREDLAAILNIGRGLGMVWQETPSLSSARSLCRSLHEVNAAVLEPDLGTAFSVAELLRLDDQQRRALAEQLWPTLGRASRRDKMNLAISQAHRLEAMFREV